MVDDVRLTLFDRLIGGLFVAKIAAEVLALFWAVIAETHRKQFRGLLFVFERLGEMTSDKTVRACDEDVHGFPLYRRGALKGSLGLDGDKFVDLNLRKS